jgi:cytochrome P450
MEAVAILAVLLRAVRLEPLTQEPPEPTLKITLRPKRPLLMTAAARNNGAGSSNEREP